jgi:hypothetical protein
MIMANIFIDILGDSEDAPKEKAVEAEPKADPRRQLRKQVINIDGEVIDDPYA